MEIKSPTPSTGGTAFDAIEGAMARRIYTAVTINDESFPAANGVAWGFTTGVKPQTARITILDEALERVLAAIKASDDRSVSLSFRVALPGQSEAIERTFHGLAVMPLESADFAHKQLVLKDHRWWWNRAIVNKSYNVLRRSADYAIQGGTSGAPGIARLVDFGRTYLEWTLNGGGSEPKPWTALDIAVDILVDVMGYPIKLINTSGAVESSYVPSNIVAQGEPAETLLARMLALSGNGLYIDNTGEIVIYRNDRPMSASEWESYLGSVGAPKAGAIRVMQRKHTRPSLVGVWCEREAEVLLSYVEGSANQSNTNAPTIATDKDEAAAQIADRRFGLENVTRTIVDGQAQDAKGNDLPRGSLVTIEEALKAFGTRFGSGPLTLANLRDHYGPNHQRALSTIYADAPARNPLDPEARAMWANIMRDYRTLFRIPRVIMERVKAINPYLADVVFEETQVRMPSPVFSMFDDINNVMSYYLQRQLFVETLDSFRDGSGQKRDTFVPVPADIQVTDQELGLVRLSIRNPFSAPLSGAMIVPGEIREPNRSNMKEDSFARWGFATSPAASLSGAFGLKENWELHAIVSIVELSGAGGSGKLEIRLAEHDAVAEVTNKVGLGEPAFIFHNHDTARYRLPKRWESFIQGDSNTHLVNKDVIEALADQEAKRVYYNYVDQAEGSATFELTAESSALRPSMQVTNIRWQVSSNGEHSVTLVAPKNGPKPHLDNMLSSKHRQALGREVSQAKNPMRGVG